MKKIIALILIAVLLCCMFAGCNEAESDDTKITQDIVEAENTNLASKQENTSSNDNENDETVDGFAIKGIKYYYKGHTASDVPAGYVLVLNVTNTTKTNYMTKFKVTFYDENGAEISKKSQDVNDFPAEHNRYVTFDSCPDFSSYSCEVLTRENSGESYAGHISHELELHVGKTVDMATYAEGNIIYISHVYSNNSIEFDCAIPTMYICYDVAIFDNTGKLYIIYRIGGLNQACNEGGYRGCSAYPILYAKDEHTDLDIPPKLTGDIQVIFALDSIQLYD